MFAFAFAFANSGSPLSAVEEGRREGSVGSVGERDDRRPIMEEGKGLEGLRERRGDMPVFVDMDEGRVAPVAEDEDGAGID